MKPILKTASYSVMAACLVLGVGCSSKTDRASTTNANGESSSAPSGKAAADAKMALVRFVNGVPGQASDLWFGDTKVFSNVGFKTVTPYKEMANERHEFKVANSGAAMPNDSPSNSEGLSAGAHYTVVAALDKNGKQVLNVINDNLKEPSAGKAEVRVINASPVEVDLASMATMKSTSSGTADRVKNPSKAPADNMDKWFSGVNANSSTNYKDVDPISTSIDVLPSGHLKKGREIAPPAASTSQDFVAGKMYTLVVTSNKGGNGLNVVKIEDSLVGPAVR